jgi:hypothetical protein
MLFPGFARFGAATFASGPPPAVESSPPTFVAAGAAATTNSSLPSVEPALPAGWQANDYFVMQCSSNITDVIATPTGWDLLGAVDGIDAVGDERATAFGRLAQSGDTSPTVMRTGDHLGARISAYRGVYTHSPIDSVQTASDQGVALSLPSVTCTGPNRMIVGLIAIDSCSGYTNANLASITERYDQAHSVGSGFGMAMFTATKATSGATGATTCNGPNTDGIGLITIALRPA